MGTLATQTKGNQTIVYSVIGIVLLFITVISLVIDSEAIFAPMLMIDLIFLTLWLFKPGVDMAKAKSAYYAIIAFGVMSTLMSVAFTILVPIYAQQWGVEIHPNDANGVLYPIVNDGRENCYIASLLFLFYFGFSLYHRVFAQKK